MDFLFGLWMGWVATLLLGRSHLIVFSAIQPSGGIVSRCWLAGYPKQQDYFWYGLVVCAGLVGVAAQTILRNLIFRTRWRGLRARWFLEASFLCAVAGTWMLVSGDPAVHGAAIVIVLGAMVLPWLDGRSFRSREQVSGSASVAPRDTNFVVWSGGLLILSVLWVWDSCHPARWLDGFHEGQKLIYIQSFLAGDLPGADVRVEYGPLSIHALWWWMSAFGLKLLSYRRYILISQMAGLFLQLVVLRALVVSTRAFWLGASLILSTSSVANIEYSAPHALRLALPMAALALSVAVPGWRRAFLGGLAFGCALLFSSEYGLAALVGLASASVVSMVASSPEGGRPSVRVTGAWVGGLLGGGALLMLVMFGLRIGEGVSMLFAPGQGWSKLMGYGVEPMPGISWPFSVVGSTTMLRWLPASLAYWGPGLILSAIAATSVAKRKAGGRAVTISAWWVFSLASLVPMLVCPPFHTANAIPAVATLGALALDASRGARDKFPSPLLAVSLLVALVMATPLLTSMGTFLGKATACATMLWSPSGGVLAGIPRLEGMRGGLPDPGELASAVRVVQAWSLPGDRVYVGAPKYSHVPFLAERAGLRPFPIAALAATQAERELVLAALRRDRPPIALLSRVELDIPFDVEHDAEWAYIRKHYRRALTIGDLMIYRRRGNHE